MGEKQKKVSTVVRRDFRIFRRPKDYITEFDGGNPEGVYSKKERQRDRERIWYVCTKWRFIFLRIWR